MKEIWKDVVGFEGIYLVSNLGVIKSIDRLDRLGRFTKGKTLKPRVNHDGYLEVVLCNNGYRKEILAHRVVAMAFISNPNNYLEINHKDENKQNNHTENLEWCTRKYNINYGTGIKRSAATKGKPIIQKNMDGSVVKVHPSIKQAAKELNIKCSSINEYLHNNKGKVRHSAAGFKWEYA